MKKGGAESRRRRRQSTANDDSRKLTQVAPKFSAKKTEANKINSLATKNVSKCVAKFAKYDGHMSRNDAKEGYASQRSQI